MPIRKRFDAQPLFPFAITYQDTKTSLLELPEHLHDWYELVYVHSGQGTFFIDSTIYGMREGDLFAIPGNTIHRAFPDAEDPVTSTAVFFNPILIQQMLLGEAFSFLQCFELGRTNRNYKQTCAAAAQAFIESCLARIDAELRSQQPGCRHAVVISLHQLLLFLNRESGGAQHLPHLPGSASSSVGPVWMKESLRYIDDHFSADIGLAELSNLVSVSAAHFSRVFKQLTGMNVTNFIATKRIIRAKELLLATEDNVATIAGVCGFESLPHFHRLFKRIAGMTPSAYRRHDATTKQIGTDGIVNTSC